MKSNKKSECIFVFTDIRLWDEGLTLMSFPAPTMYSLCLDVCVLLPFLPRVCIIYTQEMWEEMSYLHPACATHYNNHLTFLRLSSAHFVCSWLHMCRKCIGIIVVLQHTCQWKWWISPERCAFMRLVIISVHQVCSILKKKCYRMLNNGVYI